MQLTKQMSLLGAVISFYRKVKRRNSLELSYTHILSSEDNLLPRSY